MKKIGKYVLSFKKWKSTGNIRVMVRYKGRENYAIHFFVKPEKIDEKYIGRQIEIENEEKIKEIQVEDEVKEKIRLSVWFIRAFLGKNLFGEIIDIRGLSRPLKKKIKWEKNNIGVILLPKSIALLKKIAKTNYLIFIFPRTINTKEIMQKIVDTPEKILRRAKEIFIKYFEIHKNEIEEKFPICFYAMEVVRKNILLVSTLINQ